MVWPPLVAIFNLHGRTDGWRQGDLGQGTGRQVPQRLLYVRESLGSTVGGCLNEGFEVSLDVYRGFLGDYVKCSGCFYVSTKV